MITIEELELELSINIAKAQMEELKEKKVYEEECEMLGIKRLE